MIYALRRLYFSVIATTALLWVVAVMGWKR